MRIEILTIGDELLLGFTIDTNGAHLARELAAIGVEIVRRTAVGDEPTAIASAVREALDRTGAVITTGGLGPTADDMTKPSIAKLFGREMYLDEAQLAALEARWQSRFGPRPMPVSNRQQVVLPVGSRVLTNRHGSAPGVWLEDEQGRWVAMLPGVPREMRGMLADELLPFLRARVESGGAPIVVRSRTLRTTGIGESAIADRLGDNARSINGLGLAYLPNHEGTDLRVTARGLASDAADAALDGAAAVLRSIVGEHVYGEGAVDLAEVVLDRARAERHTIAVAESCTGGLLGARLTAIPGSSDVVLGGVIAYANDVKTRLLGVDGATIAEHGAVSEAVARAMARGARERTGATIGISITGVAGPSGGTPEKPVGTVWLCLDIEGREPVVHRGHFIGDRAEIRFRAAQFALELIRRALPERQR